MQFNCGNQEAINEEGKEAESIHSCEEPSRRPTTCDSDLMRLIKEQLETAFG
jgi:hypothetical protein